jgi:hypothetical protein
MNRLRQLLERRAAPPLLALCLGLLYAWIVAGAGPLSTLLPEPFQYLRLWMVL